MALFALVVGAGKYRKLSPGGRDDLWGAENDAAAWRHWLEHVFRADDVTVLSTAEGERPPEGRAILDAVAELARKMRSAGGPAAGLITFSGHGAALPETGSDGFAHTLALVPCDAERDASGGIAGAVLLGDLTAALGDVVDDVTICIDACYTSGTGDLRERRAVASSVAVGSPAPVAGRVMLGCEPWAESFELTAGGSRRGAFSVALQTLLEQWQVKVGPSGRYVNASYLDLVYRTRELLSLLGVEHTPMLIGTAHLALVPFLRPGAALAMGETSATPDQPRHGSQLDAGTTGDYRQYLLSTSTTAVVAHIIVPRVSYTANDGQKWAANKEYWYCNDMLGTPSAPISMKLQFDGRMWPTDGSVPSWIFASDTLVKRSADASWTSFSGGLTVPTPNTGWCDRPAGSTAGAPGKLALVWSSGSPRLVTYVYWFDTSNATTRFFGPMSEGDVVSFAAGSAPTAGYKDAQPL